MAGRDKLYWLRQTPALYRILSEGSRKRRERGVKDPKPRDSRQ